MDVRGPRVVATVAIRDRRCVPPLCQSDQSWEGTKTRQANRRRTLTINRVVVCRGRTRSARTVLPSDDVTSYEAPREPVSLTKERAMRRSIAAVLLVALSLCAERAHAQAGSSAANPFQESSAGRAMKRITFGAIDCTPGDPVCPVDAFTTSELFVNGTYADTRLNYNGPTNQADVSNS